MSPPSAGLLFDEDDTLTPPRAQVNAPGPHIYREMFFEHTGCCDAHRSSLTSKQIGPHRLDDGQAIPYAGAILWMVRDHPTAHAILEFRRNSPGVTTYLIAPDLRSLCTCPGETTRTPWLGR